MSAPFGGLGEAATPALLPIAMELLGGLALFLYGMEKMAEALKLVAGDGMRAALSRLTTNRVLGLLTGALVTAVIQSSSVTTVLVVGFISAGLMSLSQSIGVILGADIGTTVTAQIIAFKVTRYALAMVAVGFGIAFIGKRERIRQHGAGIMGLGLVFLGMGVMGEAVAPLKAYPPFLEAMSRMESPWLGILIATAFTALVQSSSATTGIVIMMASQGFVSLPAGISLIFGANIGTCVTAVLASIGRPREAVRAAVVHVVFKVVGVLLWIFFIDELAALVSWLSPSAEQLSGMARVAAETPRQIANAHTVFNVANGLLFLPLAAQFARLVEWMVPDRPIGDEEAVRARYLDDQLLSTPAFALDRARLEMLRLGERVRGMLTAALPAMVEGDRDELARIASMDDTVDGLHGMIVTHLGKISQRKLNDPQTEELTRLLGAANDLENIGDIIETNLTTLGARRLEHRVTISDATRAVIEGFHATVVEALDAALMSAIERDVEAARRVVEMKKEINRLAASAALHEAKRLVATEPNRLAAYTVETDILENLKRIYYFCKRMARSSLPAESLRS